MVKTVGKKNFVTCSVMDVYGVILLAREIKKL